MSSGAAAASTRSRACETESKVWGIKRAFVGEKLTGGAVSESAGIHTHMLAGSPFARPARPVADAPLQALADTEELAKGWLLLLLAQAPLAAAAQVPAADLAREAPSSVRR